MYLGLPGLPPGLLDPGLLGRLLELLLPPPGIFAPGRWLDPDKGRSYKI